MGNRKKKYGGLYKKIFSKSFKFYIKMIDDNHICFNPPWKYIKLLKIEIKFVLGNLKKIKA